MRQFLINNCLLLLYLTILICCYPYMESAVHSPPPSFDTGFKERVARKPLLRQILSLKTGSWRSSQMSSFLTDLWTNVMDFFPRILVEDRSS
ncbi:small integral membrane protein 9 isoform X2 [Vombatus ursinus]|uniref:small integral membrane protein 9 isoform X2 n=1 Tax=Vombatus ursinus TaxID=29139 RepID=UPI000FFD4BC6|nr:small integral membrane protein 9 isoform X2 [Vombatus ursinus]